MDIAQQDPPTLGWTQVPFDYYIQKPWNLNLSDRYSFDSATNTHTMWIYSTDEPFQQGNTTDPRTEMRWNEEYSTGEHMWEADVYIASGSAGSSVMQILRIDRPAGTPATDIMLVAHADNTVRRYFDSNGALINSNVYDNWWNLKVAHDADNGTIKVYADDQLVLTVDDRGPATRHFKNGVYGVDGRSETKFRNIKYWVR
ncbi:polysaccharide lyase family 7 protein [Paenibacillus sp. NPDC056579]|uniref:polysaccharide lyase family 7 protein n=1 Tax=Paenibacillus sp. NPDC056579 TaxID=3345871 RepID=UPI0036C8293E